MTTVKSNFPFSLLSIYLIIVSILALHIVSVVRPSANHEYLYRPWCK